MPASLILTIIITTLLHMRPLLDNCRGRHILPEGTPGINLHNSRNKHSRLNLGAHRLDVNPASKTAEPQVMFSLLHTLSLYLYLRLVELENPIRPEKP